MALSPIMSDTNIITFPKLVPSPMTSISSTDTITQLLHHQELCPIYPTCIDSVHTLSPVVPLILLPVTQVSLSLKAAPPSPHAHSHHTTN